MGNIVMGRFRRDRYAGFDEDQVDYLNDKWQLCNTNGFLDKKKFAASYKMSEEEAQKFIDFMDFDNVGKVDQYKFKIGAAQICQSKAEDTVKIIFDIYDFDKDGKLGSEDLKKFVATIERNLAYYNESQESPTNEQIEESLTSLLNKWGHIRKDGSLSWEEFRAMTKKDHDVVEVFFQMGLITKGEKNIEDNDYEDIDSDLECEMERRLQERDERIERIKEGIEHTETTEQADEIPVEEEEQQKDYSPPWLEEVKDLSPLGYEVGPDANNPPNAYLDLEYIYGYRCHDIRNNLKYGNKGQIVYHTAGAGISMNSEKMQQKHFLEHTDDISCLDVFDNLVVTGQFGLHPLLIVWDLNNMKMKCIWKKELLNGISNCCFSNDGTMVAACAMDEDHTVALYDIKRGIQHKKDPLSKDSGLIAFGKITKNEVFDMRFVPGDWQIVLSCMKEIYLIQWKDDNLLAEKTIWKDQKPQAALCIAFIDGYTITGMFSGQFFVWKENQLDRTSKAHASPITAIWTRSAGRGIITAGKRGIIMVWDQTLTKQYEIDSRDLNLPLIYPPGPCVIAVCESPEGKIIFGTRKSEMVEIQPYVEGQPVKAKLLMQGHYQGELWGLTIHPSSLTFYTCGEDELLAQWDAKNKRIIRSVDNGLAAKTIHISPNAKYLAVGCCNGRVRLYDPNSLQRLKGMNEISDIIDPDKETLSIVKFSPNSDLLVVCYTPPYNVIALYSTKNWREVKRIQDTKSRINCLDFSINGQFIQVNTNNNLIKYYDLNTCQSVEPNTLKDEKWFTWTCVFGWSMQGVWPKCSDGQDVNACDRSKDGSCVVTADDFGKVKLFKYPCPIPNSGAGKYSGHSSYVCGVKFTYDNQYVVSVGGDELSIFQWKYVPCPNNLNIDFSDPVQVAKLKADEQESADEQPPQEGDEVLGEEQAFFGEEELDKGDQAGACKPFLGEVQHSIPSWYKPNKNRDNQYPKGKLKPYHVHGFRNFYILDECRDMLGWSESQKLVFVSAALGVEMNIKTQEQTFFNKHEEDIVSFALHPNRKIAATGQMAQAGKAKCIDIFVWDIETKEVLANFNEFHLRAIVLLKFSPEGMYLLSVGQDDDNSLAIHDWQGKRMIVTSNVDKSKVNAAAWASEEEFVTCGNKHIKFWKIQGRNVQGKMGSQSGKFQSQYSVIYAFNKKVVISGSGDGQLLVWQGGNADKGQQAHEGKVGSLVMDDTKGVLYSGGMDGKIISWSLSGSSLQKQQEFLDLNKIALFKPGVVAMDLSPQTGLFLIGTTSSQIYQYDASSKKATLITQGHFGEELWGACTSPNSHKFVTSGADNTVRVWDIDTKKMVIASQPFKNDIRAVDWASNNQFMVCGDMKGYLYLLDPNTLEVKDTAKTKFTRMKQRQSSYWIEDLKISPDCKNVAFGAHGAASHVEVYSIKYPKFGKQKVINAGLTSALLHIDWSNDSTIVIVNSQAYEMKFVDISKGSNARSSACKDVEFHTWTCKLGFPVQGVFPTADYSDVNTICRSNSQKFLASGEDSQKVILFKYPVVVEKQKRREYIGHSSHVTRVRFTFDDNYLVSVGGNDKTIIVWQTDFGSAKILDKSKAAEELKKQCEEEGHDDVDVVKSKSKKKHKHGKQQDDDDEDNASKVTKDPNEIFPAEDVDEGDQFMAVKPWMGAIKEPTYQYYSSKKLGHKPPKVGLELEYCYGYRAKDMRNNLYYLANGKVLYNAAALGIVLDIESNTQTFFDKHEDDITAIALNPVDKMTVATGELGAKPNIFVWNADTKEIKCKFKAPLQKGIIAMAFSPSGNRIVAGAIDVDHSVAIFDVTGSGSCLWSDKGGPEVIIDVRFIDENNFATVGVKHYKAWTYENGKCRGDKGSFGSKANDKLAGIGVNGNDVVCGAADGSIQVWKGKALAKTLDMKHKGACDCVTVAKDIILTGGKDGVIFVMDKSYSKKCEIDCSAVFKNSVLSSIRSIDIDQDKKNLLVGTLGSELYLLSYTTLQEGSQFEVKNELMKGHYCPNLKWTNEVWGLDVFWKDPNLFVTASDDGTFRVWDSKARKQKSIGYCTNDKNGNPEKPDHGTGDLQDQCKARVVTVCPDDKGFITGMKNGTTRQFDQNLQQVKIFKQAKEWISDVKFSPDGKLMVVGSHDNALYAYSWPKLTLKGKRPMNKHSSYITHFDFSCDSINLHSTCGAYELLFWDAVKGKQLPGGASALKDEKWYTWTVPLGWPVQGIWPEEADGTDINAVDRSHSTQDGGDNPSNSYQMLATGDDFSQLRILRYPSLKKASEGVVGRGHSSHVTNCKWNHDDSKIFTTGGEDQCVIQWKVTKK